jgi:hypothetical protein
MMLECPVFRHAVPSQNLSCGGNRRQGPSAGIPSSDFLREKGSPMRTKTATRPAIIEGPPLSDGTEVCIVTMIQWSITETDRSRSGKCSLTNL